MTRQPDSARVSREAVTHTALAVQKELNWVFREQPTDDFGIDAQIEVVQENVATGRLLALQIKGGKSWFAENASGGWWFRLDPDHYDYWTRHSLPVVVILYNPQTRQCHWQLVTEENVERGPQSGLKLLVPEVNVLDASAMTALRSASDGAPYILRLRQLGLAKPWMQLLESGERLIVDVEEWVNKVSGRGEIKLSIERHDSERTELARWGVYLGTRPYEEALPPLFPWADLRVHEETYDMDEYEQYVLDRSTLTLSAGQWDSLSFDDWRAVVHPGRIRPYKTGGGEVDFYRLELSLNALGRSFLIVDAFAGSASKFLTPLGE
ncbi:DUF4365 domain-containing protein [Brachybacterium sp. DNPG3]